MLNPPNPNNPNPAAGGGNAPQGRRGGGQQQPQKPRCWACSKELPNTTHNACVHCGQKLTLECDVCKDPNDTTKKLKTAGRHCGNCGKDLMPQPTTAAAAKKYELEVNASGGKGKYTIRAQATENGKVSVSAANPPAAPFSIFVGVGGNVKVYSLSPGKALVTDGPQPAGSTESNTIDTDQKGLLVIQTDFSVKMIRLKLSIVGTQADFGEIHLHGPALKALPKQPGEGLMAYLRRADQNAENYFKQE